MKLSYFNNVSRPLFSKKRLQLRMDNRRSESSGLVTSANISSPIAISGEKGLAVLDDAEIEKFGSRWQREIEIN